MLPETWGLIRRKQQRLAGFDRARGPHADSSVIIGCPLTFQWLEFARKKQDSESASLLLTIAHSMVKIRLGGFVFDLTSCFDSSTTIELECTTSRVLCRFTWHLSDELLLAICKTWCLMSCLALASISKKFKPSNEEWSSTRLQKLIGCSRWLWLKLIWKKKRSAGKIVCLFKCRSIVVVLFSRFFWCPKLEKMMQFWFCIIIRKSLHEKWLLFESSLILID